MAADFEPAASPDAQRVWSEHLRPLATWLRSDARPLSAQIVEQVRTEFPDLFPDAGSFEENRAASEANLLLLADIVECGSDPASVDLPAPVVTYLRESVRRGVPVSDLLRSLRLGQAYAVTLFYERLADRITDAQELTSAISLTSTWTFALVDVLSLQIEEEHSAERDRWLRSAAASRAATIDALLQGRDVDATAASARLGYELGRDHVAALAWLDASEEGRDPLSTLEAAVGDLAASAGVMRPLLQTRGMLAVEAWLGFSAAPAPDVIELLRFEPSTAPGVRVALGDPAGGIAGFRASHEQALQAQRVATLMGRRPGSVTRYRNVAISAMATVDLEQARAFVARELGSLAADDDLALRLAATVGTYLDEGASHSRAAKRLGIHENTVRYRIRQAEEMLGRPVDERTLDLRVALKLADVVRGESAADDA
jgi:DNA-binding PucR family transcriptional regulator